MNVARIQIVPHGWVVPAVAKVQSACVLADGGWSGKPGGMAPVPDEFRLDMNITLD